MVKEDIARCFNPLIEVHQIPLTDKNKVCLSECKISNFDNDQFSNHVEIISQYFNNNLFIYGYDRMI